MKKSSGRKSDEMRPEYDFSKGVRGKYAGKVVSGYPAIDNKQWLRCVALFERLPELTKSLRFKKEASAGS